MSALSHQMTIGEFDVVRRFFLSKNYMEHIRPAECCPQCGSSRVAHILFSKADPALMLSRRDYVECPQCRMVES